MITLEEQIALHDQTAAALRAATAVDFAGQLQKSLDGVTWRDVPAIDRGIMGHYRIKKESLLPWHVLDVPRHAWFRPIVTVNSSLESLLVGRCIKDSTVFLGTRGIGITTEYLAKNFVHSVDNGATWLPCGIES